MKTRCLCCRKEFDAEDGWHFCSTECSITDWQHYADVPYQFMFQRHDPTRLQCGAQSKTIEEWIQQRAICEGLPGLVCRGAESGTGKTRLGSYAASKLSGSNWYGRKAEEADGCRPSGLWFNASRFKLEYWRVHRDGLLRGEWTEKLISADVLFVDDIDKVKATEGLLEVVFSVLDDRLTNDRTTILTTNLSGDALAERWGDDVGPYLVRRLRDYCMCVDFDVVGEPGNVVAMGGAQ